MSQLRIQEPARETPVAGEWDVVVVGGGIAGVAAALSAARHGGRVALVEKTCGLGGLATLANVIVYLPLCDGRGRQVMAGMTQELLKLSMRDVKQAHPEHGVRPVPECWSVPAAPLTPELLRARSKERYQCDYNPHSLMLELEAILLKNNVELFYDTHFCGCVREGARLSHVLVENKSGRLALAANAFIDCSGDADLCAAAGCATDDIDGNVACGWYYMLHNGKLELRAHSRRFDCEFRRDKGEGPFFSGVRGKDVSGQVIETRKDIRAHLARLRADKPEDEFFPIMLPSIPSFRATRRLRGDFTLVNDHRHVWFDDAVGLFGDWRKAGPVWVLPIGSLRTARCPNLYAAGRCLSADISVWDVTRVIPVCALSGEAAGAAAMHAKRHGSGDSNRIDIVRLQNDLRQSGNLLDPALVLEAPEVK